MRWWWLVLCVAACGRFNFDPLATGDARSGSDSGDGDAAAALEPWVFGSTGYIARWDGAAWQSYSTPTALELSEIYVAADNDVWASGQAGIARWNGTIWNTLPSPFAAGDELTSMWGRSANEVYVGTINGDIARWNGSTWTTWPGAGAMSINAMVGTPTSVYGVGDANTVVRFDGANWITESFGTANDAESVTAVGEEVYAVGQHSTLFHRTAAWAVTATVVPDRWLYAIKAFATNDIWAAGEIASVYHFDGSAWTKFNLPNVAATIVIWSVWGTSSNDVWICGDEGFIGHWDGSTWSYPPSGTMQTLAAIGL